MKTWLWKLWCSYNYRHCMVDAYFAFHQGDMLMAAEFQGRAMEWQREYFMAGRSLRHG